MNHREKLLELYQASKSLSTIDLESEVQVNTAVIAENCFQQKGVFTVVLTLAIHKILHPEQDIRRHQSNMNEGFSGRIIDTRYITPTLKELGLPSMAESGWLTRSLEQPYPYDFAYNGKIGKAEVRVAFLKLVDYIQHHQDNIEKIVILLFFLVRKKSLENEIKISPLEKPEKLNINDVIRLLENHFNCDYRTQGGAKLPVLAFYAIYQIIIKEISRYHGCVLGRLGSHTASDRTSKTAGDIEIYDVSGKLFEVIEIKQNKAIDLTVVRVAIEKIHRFNPKRYCVFSFVNIKEEDKALIEGVVKEVESRHGCQMIVNGLMPTLQYYLRLVSSLPQFLENYRTLVEADSELKKVHKDKLAQLFSNNIRLN